MLEKTNWESPRETPTDAKRSGDWHQALKLKAPERTTMQKIINCSAVALIATLVLSTRMFSQEAFDSGAGKRSQRTGSQTQQGRNSTSRTGSQTNQGRGQTTQVNTAAGMKQPGAQGPVHFDGKSLTGQWQVAFRNPDGSKINGLMKLTQKGDVLQGSGSDPKAEYKVQGKLTQNQGKQEVQLSKQYLNAQKTVIGKQIFYNGVIDNVNPKGPYFMHISGTWKFQKSTDGGPQGNGVELRGLWEAALTGPTS